MRGSRGGIAAERAERGAHRAAQHGQRVGLALARLGEREVEAQREVAPLGERAVQALDGLAVHVAVAPCAITTPTREPVGHQRGTPSTAETASSPWMGSESGILISS